MRKLNRAVAATPKCLAKYVFGSDKWDDLDWCEREEIRACLGQMQGLRCAYCEGDLGVLNHHIEHFRPRKTFPHLTFSWGNLYWSCDKADSCGHYKDHSAGTFDVSDLVDPCADDPDIYFRFRSDGTISIRSGITQDQEHRARETLRVFNLDPERGRLRRTRQRELCGYGHSFQQALDEGFSPEEVRLLFEGELKDAESLPFSTARKHVLTEGP